MNINLIKLKSVVQELRGIRAEISRIADCWEKELALNGIYMRAPRPDPSREEPTVSYTEEDMDWARETIERLKREDELKGEKES